MLYRTKWQLSRRDNSKKFELCFQSHHDEQFFFLSCLFSKKLRRNFQKHVISDFAEILKNVSFYVQIMFAKKIFGNSEKLTDKILRKMFENKNKYILNMRADLTNLRQSIIQTQFIQYNNTCKIQYNIENTFTYLCSLTETFTLKKWSPFFKEEVSVLV